MKKQVIFINGGNAKENYKNYLDYIKKIEFNPYEENKEKWHKFLENDLGKNFEIIKIPMPNKKFADYTEWKTMFEKVFPYLKENTILVGWSLGGTFLVKYFNEENINFSFSKIFLVAAAFKDSEREVIGSFNFNKSLKKLQKIQEKITFFHSKDDFVVSYEDFLDFKKVLPKANFIDFEDKNHFLNGKFPEIIEEIKK